MIKIAIGTKSAYKVNAIKRAIYNLDVEFESVFDNVPSEISDQPISKGETKQGSINRAKNVITKYSEYDLGIGVEFGYEPTDDGKYHMVCWASIVTPAGKILSEHSSSLELPKAFQRAIENNVDLDSIIDEQLKDLYKNESGRRFIEYIKKRSIIYECVNAVVLRYVFDEKLY